MLPERWSADDPREWLNRARGNLLRAKALMPGVYLEDLCFDAQQAAEKAIKGVLLAHSILFPPIHDLATLLTIFERSGVLVPAEVAEAARLTRFAVTTRYPGHAEPVAPEEYQRAVTIAAVVVHWAETHIDDHGA